LLPAIKSVTSNTAVNHEKKALASQKKKMKHEKEEESHLSTNYQMK